MGTASAGELGRYTPSERSLLVRPLHDGRPHAERRAVIILPGHGSPPSIWTPGNFVGKHAGALAEAGYYVLSPDAGGGATWGKTAALDIITAAYAWVMEQGMGSAKALLAGWSMGLFEALLWQKFNPALVAGTFGFAGPTNLDHQHANPAYTAEVDAAYDGNYAVNAIGHRINADADWSFWRDGAPIKLKHGANDATVLPADSQAFVAGVGQPQVTVDIVAGADHTTVLAAVDESEIVAFADAASW